MEPRLQGHMTWAPVSAGIDRRDARTHSCELFRAQDSAQTGVDWTLRQGL